MHRRLFLSAALASAGAIAASRLSFAAQDSGAMKGDFPPIDKSSAEWRQLLDSQQFKVLFEEATERPWTSPLNDEKRDGTYVCAACYLPLFESAAFSASLKGQVFLRGTGLFYINPRATSERGGIRQIQTPTEMGTLLVESSERAQLYVVPADNVMPVAHWAGRPNYDAATPRRTTGRFTSSAGC